MDRLVNKYKRSTGWNDTTFLYLFMEFLDSQDLNMKVDRFLKIKADEELAFSRESEPNFNPEQFPDNVNDHFNVEDLKTKVGDVLDENLKTKIISDTINNGNHPVSEHLTGRK